MKKKRRSSSATVESVRKPIAKEMHTQLRRNFVRRAVELKGLCDLYQENLAEMIPHIKLNKGYKYLVTVINAFRKFAYAVPLKTKTGKGVARAHSNLY